MKNMILILSGVLLNAFAQIALKQGMRQFGTLSCDWSGVIACGWRVGTNPFVVLGLGMYVVSVGVWLVVLSRVDVSFAYPMLSVGYRRGAVRVLFLR